MEMERGEGGKRSEREREGEEVMKGEGERGREGEGERKEGVG